MKASAFVYMAFALTLAHTASEAAETTAVEYEICAQYICVQSNVVAVAPKDFALQGTTNGLAWATWNVAGVPRPTFSQLESVKAVALAWKTNQVAAKAAEIDNMDLQFKSVLRALVKTINLRLPADKKISEDELKTAIRQEAAK